MDGHVAILHSFWSSMLTHLWQATLVLLPLFVLVRWLRKAPARVTHLVWSTGLLKLFLPLALFGGMFRFIVQWLPESTGSTSPQSASSALSVVTTVLAAPDTRFGAPAESQWPGWVLLAITLAWISGVFWLLSRLALDLHRSRSALGGSGAPLSQTARVRLDQALSRSNVERKRIAVCDRASLPTVVGLFRPMIVIPRKLIDHLSADELRAVLVHEDTHRRRFDPLRSMIHRLGAALFFFYPLLWPMLRRLHETAEFVCDESAVRAGINENTYARALSKTLQLGLSSAGSVSVSMAGGNGSFLQQRLERLTSPRRSTMLVRYRLIIAAAALLVGIGSFWPLQMKAKNSNSESKTSHMKNSNATNSTSYAVITTDTENSNGTSNTGNANKMSVAITPAPTEELKKGKPIEQKVEKTTAETKMIEAFTLEPASKLPKLIECPRPEFPEWARKAGVEGVVTVQMLVNTDGTVDSTVVVATSKDDCCDEFKKAVLAVIRGWRFEPAENDKGEPVRCWVRISVEFKLHDGYDKAKDLPPQKGVRLKQGVKIKEQPKDKDQ